MERIICNVIGMTRNETMEDRDYLVVPMVMIVEGVLNGSNGPLYYPAEELAKVPQVWNHKPVVVTHPEINGKAMSACDPEAIRNFKVGIIMNTTFDGKRLKAEAWFEINRLKEVDERVLDAVQNDKMMEVSTGLFTENEETEGEFNGKKYTAIARNYRPDHLAVLPDQIGACSIEDGAGLLRLNASSKGEMSTILSQLGFNINELSHDQEWSALYDALKEKYPDTECWIDEVYDDYLIYHIDGKIYKQSYTIKDDKAVFVDEPEEVMKKITYEPINNTLIHNHLQGDNKMDKEQIVGELISNGKWTEEDRDFLMGLEDGQLEKMAPVKNEEADTEADADAETQGDSQEAPEQNASPEDILKSLPAEMTEALNEGMAALAEQKSTLIGTITANERNQFTEDQLSSMKVTELRAIAALAENKAEPKISADFSGLAPVGNAGSTKEEPLIAPSLNFSTDKE